MHSSGALLLLARTAMASRRCDRRAPAAPTKARCAAARGNAASILRSLRMREVGSRRPLAGCWWRAGRQRAGECAEARVANKFSTQSGPSSGERCQLGMVACGRQAAGRRRQHSSRSCAALICIVCAWPCQRFGTVAGNMAAGYISGASSAVHNHVSLGTPRTRAPLFLSSSHQAAARAEPERSGNNVTPRLTASDPAPWPYRLHASDPQRKASQTTVCRCTSLTRSMHYTIIASGLAEQHAARRLEGMHRWVGFRRRVGHLCSRACPGSAVLKRYGSLEWQRVCKHVRPAEASSRRHKRPFNYASEHSRRAVDVVATLERARVGGGLRAVEAVGCASSAAHVSAG